MARYRSFLFPGSDVSESSLTLDHRESHHLVRVLRARVGETIEVLDGKGKRYIGRVSSANGKAAVVEVECLQESPRRGPRMTLLHSIPKGKAMDLILRMATEIGAVAIAPVFTSQGEVQIKGERMLSKMEKWQVTMIEACKQCGLSFLPELMTPTPINEWLSSNPQPDHSLRIVASLEESSRPLLQLLSQKMCALDVTVAVGPEGDFSRAEYSALGESGFQPVRLGDNILRAETAAAYIMSVVDQHARSVEVK